MTSGLFLSIATLLSLVAVSRPGCIYHPADRNKTCLDRTIDCSIENCGLCQHKTCLLCYAGYFMDFKTGRCVRCYPGCAGCSGPGEHDCHQIEQGYLLTNESKIIKCPMTGCGICGSENLSPEQEPEFNKHICTMCLPGYNQELIGEDTAGITCKKCEVEGCSNCFSRIDRCDGCLPGWNFVSDMECEKSKLPPCIRRALNGTCLDCKKDEVWNDYNATCIRCPYPCSDCSQPGICSYCKAGFVKSDKSNLCLQCEIPGCYNCADGPKLCVACVPGMYYDLIRKKCAPCHKDCATCTGPKNTDCSRCRANRRMQKILYKQEGSGALTKQLMNNYRSKFPDVMAQSSFMQANYHAMEDRMCLTKCRDRDYYKNRLEGFYPAYNSEDCPVVEVLHPLMNSASGGTFDNTHHSDPETEKLMKDKKKAEKRRHKAQQEDLLRREKERAEEAGKADLDHDKIPKSASASGFGDL